MLKSNNEIFNFPNKHFIWCRNFNSNKKLFPIVDNKEEIKSSQILVEFNAFQNSHVPISYLSNVLSKI